MKLYEAKKLKWGGKIYPTQLHRESFRQGKRVESGLFLGFKTEKSIYGRNHTLIRVIHENTATVLTYDPTFWQTEKL